MSPMPTFVLAVAMALFIGLRPQASCFIDSNNYIAYYNLMEGNKFYFESQTLNLIFDNLFRWMASNQLGWPVFFLVIASIYFGGMYVACMKMFPYDTLISFLVCLAAFSTFSFGTNGIKAGAAASLFLVAIAYHRSLPIVILFLCLSLGFHHSMTMPIVAFILAYFYRNIKVYFLGWCFCLIIALLNITFFQTLFAGFTDESGAQYLLSTEDWGGRSGFRFDFVIYSAMPVLVGYWAIFKKQIMSLTYEFLLSIYLTTNSIWMLCMYASFTNRIAYLSWFLYPIVLIYPFLNEDWGENKYRVFTNVVCLHLFFTLFMFFIYN
ncbi:hypothetical protein EVD32_07730 [Bacteroidales bacterium SW299]|nr:hypothetical protein [Bacteroidales bacterium SW299]